MSPIVAYLLVSLAVYLVLSSAYLAIILYFCEPTGGWGDLLVLLPALPTCLTFVVWIEAAEYLRRRIAPAFWPQSVNDTVDMLRKKLAAKDRERIACMDLVKFHEWHDVLREDVEQIVRYDAGVGYGNHHLLRECDKLDDEFGEHFITQEITYELWDQLRTERYMEQLKDRLRKNIWAA
jgi:hypothetical protein